MHTDGRRCRDGEPTRTVSVRLRMNRTFGGIVEVGLRMNGLDPVSWTLADRDVAVLDVYAPHEREGKALLVRVKALVSSWAEGERWTIAMRRLPREDWAESWKRFFKVEQVSKRIIVKPPWRSVAARTGRIIVEIEPGMSFGTGQHGTTRSCLRFLDELATRTPGALLDLGCGSGILAIAGAKLGFDPILAVDNDPTAVRIAKENARRNGVGRRATFRAADLTTMRVAPRFDVVVANILAGVLIEHAVKVVRLLLPDPRSCLILSGILTPQYARVKATYEAFGLKEQRRIRDGKWTSGCFWLGEVLAM